jgi:hypothetical protein
MEIRSAPLFSHLFRNSRCHAQTAQVDFIMQVRHSDSGFGFAKKLQFLQEKYGKMLIN